MSMRRYVVSLVTVGLSVLTISAQQYFPKEIPAGNYSGICAIGDDRYAVVSDKSAEEGFFVFHIELDTVAGRISNIENEGFRSSGLPNSDMEAICFCPQSGTLFIASEKTSEVNEYTLEGQRTGRQLAMPANFLEANKNYGVEALTYDSLTQHFYTTTERPLQGDSLHRILVFDASLQPVSEYMYRSDAPLSSKHVYGVSELCALGDGRLLVLERQVYIPESKLGATTLIRLYEVEVGEEPLLEKRLVKEFTTKLTLFGRSFANYEGLCMMNPQHLLLIADSQDQYAGVLRDWMMVVKVDNEQCTMSNE